MTGNDDSWNYFRNIFLFLPQFLRNIWHFFNTFLPAMMNKQTTPSYSNLKLIIDRDMRWEQLVVQYTHAIEQV